MWVGCTRLMIRRRLKTLQISSCTISWRRICCKFRLWMEGCLRLLSSLNTQCLIVCRVIWETLWWLLFPGPLIEIRLFLCWAILVPLRAKFNLLTLYSRLRRSLRSKWTTHSLFPLWCRLCCVFTWWLSIMSLSIMEMPILTHRELLGLEDLLWVLFSYPWHLSMLITG